MPNHKSAEKRDRQRKKRRLANRAVLGRMRTAMKYARKAVEEKTPEAGKLVTQAVSLVDRAVSKGAIKRNTGSRYIARLVRFAARTGS